MRSIPGVNWVVGPAADAVKLLAEETVTAGLLQHSIVALASLRPLLEIAEQQLRRANANTAGIEALLHAQDQNERLAKELIADDYGSIVRHGIIGMWVAIEVAVEDTATLVLHHDPTCFQALVSDGLRLPSPLAAATTEEEAAKIYKKLEPHARKSRRVGEGYCHLLKLLDIQLTVRTTTLDTLSELNYVRNCLLHRSGVVDSAAATQAPALGLLSGDRLKISSQRYLHYFDAASCFAQALLAATLISRHAVSV